MHRQSGTTKVAGKILCPQLPTPEARDGKTTTWYPCSSTPRECQNHRTDLSRICLAQDATINQTRPPRLPHLATSQANTTILFRQPQPVTHPSTTLTQGVHGLCNRPAAQCRIWHDPDHSWPAVQDGTPDFLQRELMGPRSGSHVFRQHMETWWPTQPHSVRSRATIHLQLMVPLIWTTQVPTKAVLRLPPPTDSQTQTANAGIEQSVQSYVFYQQNNWVAFLSMAEFSSKDDVSEPTEASYFLTNQGTTPA